MNKTSRPHDDAVLELLSADPAFADEYRSAALDKAGEPGAREALLGMQTTKDLFWKYWGRMHEVELWKACFLAYGINPASYSQDFSLSTDDEFGYKNLMALLISNLSNREYFSESTQVDTVHLDEFAAWCLHIEWPIESGLAALAKNKSQAIPVNADGMQSIRAIDETQPGKEPRTINGKLAIKAAWEIERSTGKRATAEQVIKKLQTWVDLDDHPELLENIAHGVKYATKKGKENSYDICACEKTLETWNKSRA